MEQTVCQSKITVAGNIFLYIFRVDETTVAQCDALLFPIKIHVLGVAHNTFGFRVDIEKSFHSVTIDNVFRDNFVNIFGGNPYVKGIVRNDFDYRSFFTKAETSGGDNFHLMDNIVLFQCLLEMFGNEMAGRSSAAGSSTNKDLQVVGAYGKATTLLGNLFVALLTQAERIFCPLHDGLQVMGRQDFHDIYFFSPKSACCCSTSFSFRSFCSFTAFSFSNSFWDLAVIGKDCESDFIGISAASSLA